MKILFFGTPEFAIPSLSRLLEEGEDVKLAVTRPDRPVGRQSEPVPSPVARFAAERGIATEKPERLKSNEDLLRRLRSLQLDVAVVVAYGKILPREILDLPRLGCVNVHASLLPKYRGASPIQAALLAGDHETGVVTMKMEEQLDSGPIYLERRTPVAEREDARSLSQRLSRMGAELLIETLRGLEEGILEARPQVGEPSFCRPLRREEAQVDWAMRSEEIDRRRRAFTPWPGLYTFLDEERIKILDTEVGREATSLKPGTLWLEGGQAFAAAGEGTTLLLERLQRSGGKSVTGAEFLRGIRKLPARFGPHP